MMLPKFQVTKGFEGAKVQIVGGSKKAKIVLENATQEQLKQLHEIKHPAVKAMKPPTKKSPGKPKS